MTLNNSLSESHCLQQITSSWTNYAGFFGEPTSTINWCERDYEHSYYIAETYNTISNAWYIIFACLAAWQLRYRFYPKLFAIQNRDQKKQVKMTGGINGELIRFYAVCLGLALVGVGSWCFHMTLTVQHQMFDEIAMHLPIICHIYGLLNMRDYTKVGLSKKEKRWFMFLSPFHFVSAISSIVLFSGLLWIYDVRNQALFESVFFFEVLFCFIASFQFAYEQAPGNRAAERHKKAKVQLLWTIFISLVTGFGVWNIDSHFCSPFVDQFKLHSFWHLFTAYGVYLNIIWLVFSYYSLKSEWITQKQDHPSKGHSQYHSYSLKWNYLFIPSIEFEECKYE